MLEGWNKWIAMLLILGLVGAFALLLKPNSLEKPYPKTQPPLGRYMEERIPLPEEMNYIVSMTRLENGDAMFFGNYYDHGLTDSWDIWRWGTDGVWKPEQLSWLNKALEEWNIESAILMPDKSLFFNISTIRPELVELLLLDFDAFFELPFETRNLSIAGFWSDDKVYAEAAIPLVHPVKGLRLSGVKPAGDGYYLVNFFHELYILDSLTGEMGNAIDSNPSNASFLAFENQVIVSYQDRIGFYNLFNGVLEDSITCTDRDNRVLWLEESERALYYADQTGIYRTLLDGSVTERLIDGELAIFGMPSVQIESFVRMEDGSFLLLCSEAASEPDSARFPLHTLLRYTFQPDVPASPSSQIRVYSLEENKTIRQALGMYQQQNPDVWVRYEVGMTGNDGISASEAVRSISLKLIAGEGPDVLVLDGLPIEFYIQTGFLLDIQSEMEGILADTHRNITDAYSNNGRLYAAPARFTVPMMAAKFDAAFNIRNLENLVDWLENLQSPALSNAGSVELLSSFYAISYPDWIDASGNIQEEAFAAFLENIGRLNAMEEVYKAASDQQKNINYYNHMKFGSLLWMNDIVPLIYGNVNSFSELASSATVINSWGDGVVTPLPASNGNGVVIPRTIMAVNASSGQQELASDFIRLVFSEELLSFDFEDGMPVNRAALKNSSLNPFETRGYYSVYGTTLPDSYFQSDLAGTEYILSVNWPREAFFEEIIRDIEKMETIVPVDAVQFELLVEATEGYFTGEKTIAQTTSDFQEKMREYHAMLA